MIDFYYAPTPNGWKIAIMLAETSLDHRTILLQLPKGDQLAETFRKINPNAKIPAIVDHNGPGGRTTVFESGAILLYLANKTGRFQPEDPVGQKEMMEWLFWQASNQGPMAGQLSHFVNYAPDDQAYSMKRYKGEFERSLAVLDRRLQDKDYILGDYSIVDMMAFPWAFIARPLSVSLERFPNVSAWRRRIKARPAVISAINLFKEQQFSDNANAENAAVLFNQSADHLNEANRAIAS